ncbi:hypothetical protein T10_567 [Trichinella papuae]|uniref:Uncharacterized protein n=1 Tax=Trichinella papuae TaxID=268474 RepID=A0A0V1MYU8_9BILA|nr:hypothetical protein T10_567 [Trichinella papuae]
MKKKKKRKAEENEEEKVREEEDKEGGKEAKGRLLGTTGDGPSTSATSAVKQQPGMRRARIQPAGQDRSKSSTDNQLERYLEADLRS